MKKNLVIVVDMLDGFIKKGNLANPSAGRMIPNIKELLRRKKKEGWEILFLADNHKKGDLEFEMFPEHCISGTDETNVVEELREFVTSDNYIGKTRYSGLFKTRLEKILDFLKPGEIVVVGIYADICVLYTTADLRNRDYQVTIPKDCTMTLAGIDEAIFAHMEKILGVNVIEKQEML
ncbi:MAG: isochorismatase family cysteine hydrolase [Minisyncoccia bacterium]